MSKARTKRNQEDGFNPFILFITLVIVAGITILILSIVAPSKQSGTNTNTSNNTSSSSSDNSDDAAASKTPSQYEKDDDFEPDPTSINMSITKNEVVGDKYQVRVTIYEIITGDDGVCDLEMKSEEGNFIHRSANLINAGPDSTSCEGFDIKTNEITPGDYEVTITVESGERYGEIFGTIKI